MAESKSIEQVKDEIANLKYEVEDDINVTNELTYTDEEIERLLRKLPVVMFQAAQTIVLKLIEFKEAKRRLKKEFAIQMMKANHNKALKAAPDRKAWAEDTKEYERAEIAVINSEAEYKIAEFRLEMLENLYLAVKKMVVMRTAQAEAEDRYYKGRPTAPRRQQ